jgi:hypothetical protein
VVPPFISGVVDLWDASYGGLIWLEIVTMPLDKKLFITCEEEVRHLTHVGVQRGFFDERGMVHSGVFYLKTYSHRP